MEGGMGISPMLDIFAVAYTVVDESASILG